MKRIFLLDWGNAEADSIYQMLQSRHPYVTRIPFTTTLADGIRQCAILADTDYFWVTSSTTDYSNFDFDAYSEAGLEPYLQVFGHNTWMVSKYHIKMVPMMLEPVEAFPDLHFVDAPTLKSLAPLLDIVYISNGEPYAEKHYQHLLDSVKTGNKIHRVNRINGRTAAYHAAATASTTAWFFAVFAKLEVESDFDWTWHPDTVKGPKHYIFHARNPVNGLEYGHMAMVCYNKSLTLATEFTGLDFVMTKPHEVVPVLSGTAHYNQDPIVTWRSAFRECIKLKQDNSEESLQRLATWLGPGVGDHCGWSVYGAKDAVEYYEQVNGEFEKLLLSYDWAWLNQYFQKKYNLSPTRQ